MKAVNLIPAPRLAVRRRQWRVRTWAAAGTLYGLALLVTLLLAHGLWGQTDRALAEQLAELEADADHARQVLEAFEPQLEQATRKLEGSRAVASQPDWSLLLALLADVRGRELALNRIHFTPQRAGDRRGQEAPPDLHRQAYRIEISGVGENQQAVSRFVLRLEGADVFDHVKLAETSRTTVNDQNAVAFRLLCLLSEKPENQP